ncbi:MAG: ABC transporter ATP-binding protein [Deltaproteobacteria bacterium]|nr:ABC transporter ATP-binding protein [Deltaproteobacteria bacterium]
MTALSVENLHLDYAHKGILHGLTFHVPEEEFFIIIGPNGAGKTTLLKACAGMIQPQRGEINILGKALHHYSRRSLSRLLAVVPQQVPLDFPFPVTETVLMGRSPHLGLWSMEKREDYRIAEEAMHFTDITHLAERRLDQLSSGERQRVMIARAICQQPRIIFLDEPTASLDPSHQSRIMDLMERLRRTRRITVIMISHDLNLAALYGDRLLLLKEGEIEKTGRPGEVLTAEQLRKSYGCTLLVDQYPLSPVPRIATIPEKYRKNPDHFSTPDGGRLPDP